MRMKSYYVHFVLIALCAFALLCGETVAGMDKCGDNEIYSKCYANPSCQKSCNNIDTWEGNSCPKTRGCKGGCICKQGYVWDDDGNCIWENSCPRVRH